MLTDLTELLGRLELQFELLIAGEDDGDQPHPFGYAMLAAIDLIEEIKRAQSRGDDPKLSSVIDAWQKRDASTERTSPKLFMKGDPATKN
jgi:hypothetical protein